MANETDLHFPQLSSWSDLPWTTSESKRHNVPIDFLSDDDTLTSIPEFRLAENMDLVYVPICSGVGIIGNFLCVIVLTTSEVYRSSTTGIHMIAISIFDTLVQANNIIFYVRRFLGVEVFTQATCGFLYFIIYYPSQCSVFVLVAMTIERYLAIRFPFKANVWFSLPRAKVTVVTISVLTLTLNAPQLFFRGMVWNESLEAEICQPIGAMSEFYAMKVWPWIDSLLYCYLPFVSLAILNVLLVRQMNKSHTFRKNNASSKLADQNRHVTMMLLFVTCAFLVLVGPLAVIIVIERYLWFPATPREEAMYYLTRSIVNNLLYTNHAITFILYSLSGSCFRREFLKVVCSKRVCGAGYDAK